MKRKLSILLTNIFSICEYFQAMFDVLTHTHTQNQLIQLSNIDHVICAIDGSSP